MTSAIPVITRLSEVVATHRAPRAEPEPGGGGRESKNCDLCVCAPRRADEKLDYIGAQFKVG